jgi:hypothetical protein
MSQVTRPNGITFGSGRIFIFVGNGTPDSHTDDDVPLAKSGSLFLRMDGGAGRTLYVKEGDTWTAK